MPQSVSPGSIPAPPMAANAAQHAASMSRRSTSDIRSLDWSQIPGGATAAAASADGSLWVLSIYGPNDTDRYIYHYVNGGWVGVPGAANRIAVGPDGAPWVTNAAGGIYHYQPQSNGWSPIAGGASDITVATDGSVYVVSSLPGNQYGRGIWHYANGGWTQVPGAAVRIAASRDNGTYPGPIMPGGFYVTNALNDIYYANPGSGFIQVTGQAVALAPSPNGGLFALRPDDYGGGSHPIYYEDVVSGVWTQHPGAAVDITTDGTTAWVIGRSGGIYRSAVTKQFSISDLAPAIYLADTDHNQILAYTPGKNGSTAIASTIVGDATCLQAPLGLALDASNKLYVINRDRSCPALGGKHYIAVFNPGANGNVAPSMKFTWEGGAVGGAIAVDTSLDLFVTAPHSNSTWILHELVAGTYSDGGDATYPKDFSGGCGYGCDNAPVLIGLDGKTLAVATMNGFFYADSTVVPAPGQSVPSSGSFTSSSTPQVSGGAFDGNGNLVVSSTPDGIGTPAQIVTFTGMPTGTNPPPSSILVGAQTQIGSPRHLAIDAKGYLYVYNANSTSCNMLVFAPGASGNAAPLTSWPVPCGAGGMAVQRQ